MDSLNAFRAVLVAATALAMLISFALGNIAAGLWLLLAVTLHSALWVYLWRVKRQDAAQMPRLDEPTT